MATHKQSPSGRAAPLRPEASAAAQGALAGLRRGFRALSIRNYRLFWVGQVISWTGSWMQSTAQAWLVLQIERSPLALGLVTTAQFLPFMLLSLFGGVVADRLPKHRLIMATQVAGLLQAGVFGLLVGSGHIQIWHIYVLAAIQGTVNAFDNPARQSFVPELVGREHLANAVALNSTMFNTARVLGPALGGVMIAQIGIAPAMYINTASFLAAIGGLLLMDRAAFHPAPPQSEGSVRQRLAEGLSYAARTPTVLLVLAVVAVMGMFGFNYNVTIPLLAGFVLHSGAAGLGMLSAALGAGSLAGALTAAYRRQVSLGHVLVSAGAFGLLLAAVAVTSFFPLALLLLALLGFVGVLMSTAANTLVQLSVPDELRGRVMSLYVLLFIGSTPIGAFLIGVLSNAIGVVPTVLLCALCCLLGVGGAALYRARVG